MEIIPKVTDKSLRKIIDEKVKKLGSLIQILPILKKHEHSDLKISSFPTMFDINIYKDPYKLYLELHNL